MHPSLSAIYIGETGAGHPPDERVKDLADRIHSHQSRNVKHDAVQVPRHANPFDRNPDEMGKKFVSILDDVVRAEIVPEGYGMHPDEWEENYYPDTEKLVVGGQRKPITLSLADPIWKARATHWVQALSVLSHFQMQ